MYLSKYRILACVCLALVLANAGAYAQKVWTLQDCVDYAISNNLTVKRNEINKEINQIAVTQNKLTMLPTLNGQAGRNWNFGRTIDPFTNLFTTQQVQSDNVSLNSNVTLFSGFQLWNTLRQSELDYYASQSDLQKIRNDISLNVVSAYLQVLFAREQLVVSQNRIQQAREQRDRVAKMVAAGAMVQGNLLDAESQLSNEELAGVTAENTLANAKLTLTQLLQLPTPEGFEVSDPGAALPETTTISMTPDQIFGLAIQNLPEVKGAEQRIQSAQKGLLVARGGMLPRLAAFGSISSFYSSSSKRFVGGSFIGYSPSSYITSSGEPVLEPVFSTILEDNPYGNQMDQNLNKSVGLSLNVPLFNGFSTQSNIRRARLNLENARLAAETTRNTVFQSIQQAHNDAQAARKRFDATQKNVVSFQEAYNYAEKRFGAGVINSLEFLTAANNLTRTKVELLQAKYDYIFRLKVLDFYAGKPLTF